MIENITFDDFDAFDRKEYAQRLTKVIKDFSPFHDESYVLSLNAEYGSGKTTFLKMWKHLLEQENMNVVYINAWETDFDEEPLIPIISSIIDAVGQNTASEKLVQALETTLGAFVLSFNDLFAHQTGLNVKKIIEEIEAYKTDGDLQKTGENLYKEFSFKRDAYAKVKETLEGYLKDLNHRPLIIMVDELDRVRPSYAIKFLEAIKHMFSIHGICFVLAVDVRQLEASTRQLYGDIDFKKYYMRFVTRQTDLPDAIAGNLTPFLEKQGARFFKKKSEDNVRFPFDTQATGQINQLINVLAKTMKLNPREIEHLLRMFCQIVAIDNNKQALASWLNSTLILCALFITNKEMYIKLGSGSAIPDEILKFLEGLDYQGLNRDRLKETVYIEIFSAYLNGDVIKDYELEIGNIFLDLYGHSRGSEGLDEIRGRTILMLIKHENGSHYPSAISRFEEIYDRIENWKEFID